MFGVGIIRGIYLERSLIRYYLRNMGKGRWAQIPHRFAVIRLQVGYFTYWLTSRQGLGTLSFKGTEFWDPPLSIHNDESPGLGFTCREVPE